MKRIEEISSGLTRNPDGIYVSNKIDTVSYSPTGHADCFQIEDNSFWFQHRNNCIVAMIARQPYEECCWISAVATAMSHNALSPKDMRLCSSNQAKQVRTMHTSTEA